MTADRLARWATAFEFAVTVSAIQACMYLIVARFGGQLFATTFDETEIRCALAGTLLAFPFVAIGARYRCVGKP